MRYQPITGVWEITMGCNMKCMHCGSSCNEPLNDELTTEEALDVCDQIADIGLKWITLSGGEPLTRKDLPLLIERLSSKKVTPNIISNGWLMTKELAKNFSRHDIGTVAISVDGNKKIHDEIRREGSFERLTESFKTLKEYGITTGAVTTVNKKNIGILEEIKEFLVKEKIEYWQIQLALPMGNMKDNKGLILNPVEVNSVIDFIHKTSFEGKIKAYPADCLGYYDNMTIESLQNSLGLSSPPIWQGCNAGKRSFGILQNGDILGCTSIRDAKYIEGNLRKNTLKEIWVNENNFKWNREMKKSKLKGNCQSCIYGDVCLGGCPNTRLTMNGDIYSDNKYCTYSNYLEELKEITFNSKDLKHIKKKFFQNLTVDPQISNIFAKKLLDTSEENIDFLCNYGFNKYLIGDIDSCIEINKKILAENPNNLYALSGLGIALCQKEDEFNNGINYLKSALHLSKGRYTEAYNDLLAIYQQNNLHEEILKLDNYMDSLKL